MADRQEQMDSTVYVRRFENMISIVLNRPRALNSLNTEMTRFVQRTLAHAREEDHVRFVLFYGAGDKGFCAGGDIKALAQAAGSGNLDEANEFFEQEYAMDLAIHQFPKPVVVLADGVTMGGGLGIAAGADIVIATERTRMAMPETRIGFFPDVGATGWLFRRCPAGYPEFLGLSGHDVKGQECVRIGLASQLVRSEWIPPLIHALETFSDSLPEGKKEGARRLEFHLSHLFERVATADPQMDEWVRTYYAGKESVREIIESLSACAAHRKLCEDFFHTISERSPTSLALALALLRRNEGRPMEEVLATDVRAARFMAAHHDFLEGVRARVIDKDDNPRWQPDRLGDVHLDSALREIFLHDL